ncbi:hypothetical protein C8R45DRAFT_601978 [Mycena sanguinolenta]|nr:hypothetical protein C8R45DRAFT_601978 [Mycena sanguinolenta]
MMPAPCSACGAFPIPSGDDIELNITTAPRTLARFAQLASTNEPPREPELALIRPIVEKTSARLASLDAEISRLKERLRELEDEHNALSGYHAQNTRILSPLRRMPAEILGEIFAGTLPSGSEVFAIENCPWILTYVCSRWRAVALSKPSLWSLITIDFTANQHYSLKLIRTQLERARLLKIQFFMHQDYGTGSQIALFNVLAKHSARWEELSIQFWCRICRLSSAVSRRCARHGYSGTPQIARLRKSILQPSSNSPFLSWTLGSTPSIAFSPRPSPCFNSSLGTTSTRYGRCTASSSNRFRTFRRFVYAAISMMMKTGRRLGTPLISLHLRRLYVSDPPPWSTLGLPAWKKWPYSQTRTTRRPAAPLSTSSYALPVLHAVSASKVHWTCSLQDPAKIPFLYRNLRERQDCRRRKHSMRNAFHLPYPLHRLQFHCFRHAVSPYH